MLKALAALGGVVVALAVTASIPRSSPVVTSEAHPGMVGVAAGPFAMGSTEEEVQAAYRAYGGGIELYRPEVPRRILDLPAFWIDRTEVTNDQYLAFVEATGHPVPDAEELWAAPYRWKDGHPPPGLGRHPVTLVSVDDARDFCRWRGMELPTEEQWEKAARGTDGRTYPWGDRYSAWRLAGAEQRSREPLDNIDRWRAWWSETYRKRMRGHEVGTFEVGHFPGGASPWGALDMAGNVFEWVDGTFDAYPGSPYTHPEFGVGFQVVRGGDWYLDRIYHRAAARLRAPPEHRVPTIGFRCACSNLADRHTAVTGRSSAFGGGGVRRLDPTSD
jgi:formylglycine-generating enzyme required for sulfatase activity